MQKFRLFSYTLIGSALSFLALLLVLLLRANPTPSLAPTPVEVQARARQAVESPSLLNEVIVGQAVEAPGPPSVRSRYTFANRLPEDIEGRLSLVVTDRQTGATVRLGDETGGAAMKGWDQDYLFWYFGCGLQCATYQNGLYAYSFADKQNIFVSDKFGGIHPKHGGDWVAQSVKQNANAVNSMLFATNLRTHETIMLTTSAPIDSILDSFAISPWLAVWKADPPDGAPPGEERLAIYDLTSRTVITEINPRIPMGNLGGPISRLGAGQTVITWNAAFGYDLITRSYFPITRGVVNAPVERFVYLTPVTEENRILHWTVMLTEDEDRYYQAPLIDATPSAAPCVAGQNLVQNGDLEDVANHALWQQSGSPSNLLVNDPPPGAPNGGQWAIRLGRYRNAQQSMRQLVAIPSGVKALTLHFDVQVATWDRWGGDWLGVDLVDPASGQSYLVTPVRWRNTQLASPDWLPITVQIDGWPAVDAPVYLALRGLTDWAIPTDFTLDNMQLITQC